MLIPLPPKSHRRRARTKLPTTAAPVAGLTVVGVEGVEIFGGQLQINVIFDTTFENPINDPSGADPAKWTARFGGQKYTGVLLAAVVEDRIYLLLDPAGAEAGADVLNYANAPSDISDSSGRFLAAFSGLAI